MALSLMSLNIERGKFLSRQIEFFRSFPLDIICLQETVSGAFNFSPDKIDTTHRIARETGMQYTYVPHVTLADDPGSGLGLAVLYKHPIKLEIHETFYMMPPTLVPTIDVDWSTSPRCGQLVKLLTPEGHVWIVNVHLAWSPKSPDTPERLRQAKLLTNYLQKFKDEPLIITGDFNATPESAMMPAFRAIGRDMITEHRITNTINYNLHRNAKTMDQGGLVIDYMFIQKRINVRSFKVVDRPDLSDHYGLMTHFDLP